MLRHLLRCVVLCDHADADDADHFDTLLQETVDRLDVLFNRYVPLRHRLGCVGVGGQGQGRDVERKSYWEALIMWNVVYNKQVWPPWYDGGDSVLNDLLRALKILKAKGIKANRTPHRITHHIKSQHVFPMHCDYGV